MQTFLPFADFEASARVLDQKRLGKQRVETFQVLQALSGRKIENTFHMEETGRFRELWVYYTDEEYAALWNGDDPDWDGADGYVVYDPIMKRVDHPESEWYTVEYWPKGWVNHPVAKMWSGHLATLMEYQMAVCREWAGVRGYRDTCLAKAACVLADSDVVQTGSPSWLGDPAFHRSHKQALISKNPDFYQSIWPDLLPVYDYVWPIAS